MNLPQSVQAETEAPRPSGPKVFGVLSIIFASLTIFSSLMGGCSLAMTKNSGALGQMAAGPGGAAGQGMAAAYARFYESTYLASASQVVLFLILSVLLLVVGIGQLRYRRWARLASQAWGAAALVALGVMQALSIIVIHPASERLLADLTGAMQIGSAEAKMMGWMSSLFGGSLMSGVTLIFYLPYPLLLVIYFGRRLARQAMVVE